MLLSLSLYRVYSRGQQGMFMITKEESDAFQVNNEGSAETKLKNNDEHRV